MNHISVADTAEPIKIKIVIPTNVYFLSGIRNFTLDTAKNVAGFDEQWAYRFQTVVDELTNNAIEHGSREGEEVELNFEIDRQKSVRVTVSDHGDGKSNLKAADIQKLIADAKENAGKPSLALRGRGFQIMNNWSDELTITDNEYGGISASAYKEYQADELTLQPAHVDASKNVFVLEV